MNHDKLSFMDHFKYIYTNLAGEYHRMISCEDVDHHLSKIILDGINLKGAQVLDLGSGTGRIPLLIREKTKNIYSIDISYAMLLEQARQRQRINGDWDLIQGDMGFLPLKSDFSDLTVAAWSIGHSRGLFREDWERHIERMIIEMQRVTKPGGVLMIIETMSTGSLVPIPPNSELAEYYEWLVNSWKFNQQVIQTDYIFSSVDEAVHKTEFFFGQGLAEKIRTEKWARLPEWTGVWRKINQPAERR